MTEAMWRQVMDCLEELYVVRFEKGKIVIPMSRLKFAEDLMVWRGRIMKYIITLKIELEKKRNYMYANLYLAKKYKSVTALLFKRKNTQ